MELRRYLGVLLRGWWILLLLTGGCYLGARLCTQHETKLYSATTTLVVSPSPAWANNYREILDALDGLDKRSILKTYVTILGSLVTQNKASAALHLTPEQLLNVKVTALDIVEANAVQIQVEAGDPKVAADMANTLAQQALTDLKNLYQVYDLSQIDQASPPTDPIRPVAGQDILGVPAGLALGTGLLLLLYYLRVPVPTLIPSFRRRAGSRLERKPGYQALSKQVRQELRRLPRRARELGLIMVALSSSADADAGSDRLRAQLQPALRRRDTIVNLPEAARFAVILPGANMADAARIVEQTRARIAADGDDMAGLRWAVAEFERRGGAKAMIGRAEAGLAAPDQATVGAPAALPGEAPGRAAFDLALG